MGTTPIYQIPYTEPPDDVATFPATDKAAAERVDAILGGGVVGGLGVWVDCTAEIRWCTDANTTANAGSSIGGRYMKIGKTVFLIAAGQIGSAAVANFALLLPASAGVPRDNQQAGILGYIGTPGMGGGCRTLGTPSRLIFYGDTSTAYADSSAGAQGRINSFYEVL